MFPIFTKKNLYLFIKNYEYNLWIKSRLGSQQRDEIWKR